MSSMETQLLAIADVVAFALAGYSWAWPWFRARREKIPLRFLTIFTLWAEGAPIHELLNAYVQLRNAGAVATIRQLRQAWWDERDRSPGASEIAAAAVRFPRNAAAVGQWVAR